MFFAEGCDILKNNVMTRGNPVSNNKERGIYMKYCSNCGAQLRDDAASCPYCGCPSGPRPGGQYGQYRGGQYQQYQPYPGQNPYYQNPYGGQRNPADVNSTGLNGLSFFFPMVGLILYLVWNSSMPIKAKGVGKWALIGFCVGVGFVLLWYILIFAML